MRREQDSIVNLSDCSSNDLSSLEQEDDNFKFKRMQTEWNAHRRQAKHKCEVSTEKSDDTRPCKYQHNYCNCKLAPWSQMRHSSTATPSQQECPTTVRAGNKEDFPCTCKICQECDLEDLPPYPEVPLKSCEGKIDMVHTVQSIGESKSRNKEEPSSKSKLAIDRTVTKRLKSAKRNTMNELKGQVNVLEIRIKELQKENSTYKLLQYRQDKALTRYQGEFAELPVMIKSHKEEMQGVRQLLKKAESKCRTLEETVKLRDKRIEQLKEENYKLSSFVHQYDMGSRYKMLLQLRDAKTKLKETQKKLQVSNHHVEVLHKSQQQHAKEDYTRMKSSEINLYKAHMRNEELLKCIREQATKLKNSEDLIVKTIRKNNMPKDPNKGDMENPGDLVDMSMDIRKCKRPNTYTLNLSTSENSSPQLNTINMNSRRNSVFGKDDSPPIKSSVGFCENTIKCVPDSNPTIKDDICISPIQKSVELVKPLEHVPMETIFVHQRSKNDVKLYCDTAHVLQEDFKSHVDICSRRNFPALENGISGELEKQRNIEQHENFQRNFQNDEDNSQRFLREEHYSNMTSCELELAENSLQTIMNKYEAGDEAGKSRVALGEIEKVESGTHSFSSSYKCIPFMQKEPFFETTASSSRNDDGDGTTNKNTGKQYNEQSNSQGSHHPFVQEISEEYFENFLIEGNGRNKKSFAILKKRKNAIFRAFPFEGERTNVGQSSSQAHQFFQMDTCGDGDLSEYNNTRCLTNIADISGDAKQTDITNSTLSVPEIKVYQKEGRRVKPFVSFSR